MHDLTRTVLVTGASSGIGRAVAKRLLRQGHHVIAMSRDIKQFTRQAEHFTPVQIDLSNLPQLPEQIRLLEKNFPQLDAIIFCAGIGRFASLEEFSYEQIQLLITLNFTSQAFLARGLVPGLKTKSQADLVFIGSEAALKGSRKGAVYCASKFALRGFCQALREECAKSNVRVSLINPGMVKTPFYNDLSFAPGDDASNFLLPEDVAAAVSFVLEARQGVIIDEINLNPANKVVKFNKK